MSRMRRFQWLARIAGQQAKGNSCHSTSRQDRRLRVEQLEDRRLLAVFSVSNLGDAGAGSLRQAMIDANGAAGADTIDFSVTGTINIASQLPTITDDVTITGPGADQLTIDAGDGTDNTFGTGDGFRIFNIGTAGDFDTELFLYSSTGGSVLASNDDSSPSSGGGGSTSVRDSYFEYTFSAAGTYVIGVGKFNSTGGIGGITGDAPDTGDSYTLQVSVENHPLGGGGVDPVPEAEPNSSIATAHNIDGAGWNLSSNSNIANSTTIPHITVEGTGDGTFDYYSFTIANAGDTTVFDIDNKANLFEVFLSGLTLIGGDVSGEGGAIINSADLTVTSSTISGNSTELVGGGIFNNGTATITSSTISGNSAPIGSEILLIGIGSANLNDNNLLGDSSKTTAQALDGVSAGASDILATSDGGSPTALGAILGPLADNGGPTRTHALMPDSPALDAANSAELTDQRSLTVPVDLASVPNATGGNGSDIGAYEAQVAPSADFVDDDIITGLDFLAWQLGFGTTSGAMRADGNSDDDGDVDASDLAAWEATYGLVELTPLIAAASSPVAAISEQAVASSLPANFIVNPSALGFGLNMVTTVQEPAAAEATTQHIDEAFDRVWPTLPVQTDDLLSDDPVRAADVDSPATTQDEIFALLAGDKDFVGV